MEGISKPAKVKPAKVKATASKSKPNLLTLHPSGKPLELRRGEIIAVVPFADLLQAEDKEATHQYSDVFTSTREFRVKEKSGKIWEGN